MTGNIAGIGSRSISRVRKLAEGGYVGYASVAGKRTRVTKGAKKKLWTVA